MPTVALGICLIGVGVLFLFDRDRSVRCSRTLWLPVIWLCIIGSRPVSVWLGTWSGGAVASGQSLDSTLEGNSVDALVLSGLLALGIAALLKRRSRVFACLRGNWLVIVYFAYCLLSVLWSPYPDAAAKRWFRALGDLVMTMVVVTDPSPGAAIARLFSRVGFLLLPVSLYMIRYSPLGRGYDPDGNPMNTGVTTNKNTLGVLAFIVGLAAVANVRGLLYASGPQNRRRLLAQAGLVMAAIAVLTVARSATSIACFALGTFLIAVTSVGPLRARPWAVNSLIVVTAALAAVIVGSGAQAFFFDALGRDASLTGRTDIWQTVMPLAIDPWFGAGFESFWNAAAESLRNLPDRNKFGNLNSAHNGYIDVYLNLGLVGLVMMIFIVLNTCRRASGAMRVNADIGALFLAFTITTLIYSMTEAGFRVMSLTWISLLLAGFGSGVLAVQRATDKVIPEPQHRLTPRPGTWRPADHGAKPTAVRLRTVPDPRRLGEQRRGTISLTRPR